MKYDCLIIDDEKELNDNTAVYFNMFDVKTASVYSSAEADSFFQDNEASLILLDINLSDGNGFELCRKIRQTMNIPILFISARNTDDDKIIALNIGGDDYIEKPYSLGVLLAKVKVVLKRYSNMAADTSDKTEFDDGHLRLDPANKAVFVDGVEKKITSIEWKLLEYLIENRNRLVTKTEIFDKVWNDKFTTDGTLNVHVRKIREAIEKDPQDPKYIVTVWKEGYKFVAPE
ncbi:MAG: response regulator transcription factor [Ruminococcaceae bacterium]|nr:response regulator transcription factor [Oscillospiraceae bacterium]